MKNMEAGFDQKVPAWMFVQLHRLLSRSNRKCPLYASDICRQVDCGVVAITGCRIIV